MAWVKEIGKDHPKWVEDKPYTGAVVHGYAWNCPEEKECPERKAINAFSLVLGPLHKKPAKVIIIQSCLYWIPKDQICCKPQRIVNER